MSSTNPDDPRPADPDQQEFPPGSNPNDPDPSGGDEGDGEDDDDTAS